MWVSKITVVFNLFTRKEGKEIVENEKKSLKIFSSPLRIFVILMLINNLQLLKYLDVIFRLKICGNESILLSLSLSQTHPHIHKKKFFSR